MALVARVAAARAGEHGEVVDPLVVSTDFLRPPAVGPVLLRTEVRKLGRQVCVIQVRLEQRGHGCLDAAVTLGKLPAGQPLFDDLPEMPAEPPTGALSLTGPDTAGAFNLRHGCEVRVDPGTAGYLAGRGDQPPLMRLWA